MKSIRRAFLRNILLIIAIVGFGLVIFGAREELAETRELIKGVDLRWLVLLPLTSLTSYFFLSEYYRRMIANFGGKVKRMRAFGTTVALNFINQILPSGGASGIAYVIFAYKDVIDGGKTTLIQLGRYLLAFLSYFPMLLGAAIYLGVSGQLTGSVRTLLIVLILISLPGATLIILAIANQPLVDKLVSVVVRLFNKLAGFFTRGKHKPVKTSGDSGFVKEFHDGVAFLKSQGHKVIVPFLFVQLSTIAEIMVVNIAFAALGVNVDPGIIILGFTAANVAGVISVIPGDVGVHELAMITVLGLIGVEQSTAIAGTLLYRVFNKLIIMSIGFVCYVVYLKPLIANAKKNGT